MSEASRDRPNSLGGLRQKQNGRRCTGAGISPDAVPSREAQKTDEESGSKGVGSRLDAQASWSNETLPISPKPQREQGYQVGENKLLPRLGYKVQVTICPFPDREKDANSTKSFVPSTTVS
jgi:hypothetical protein